MVEQPPAVTTQHSFDPNDALQAGGFVERRLHPSDRRATLVTLTELGTPTEIRLPSGPETISKVTLYADDSKAFMNEVRRHL